jgi:flagella basal body P-ring formation protein FlgA
MESTSTDAPQVPTIKCRMPKFLTLLFTLAVSLTPSTALADTAIQDPAYVAAEVEMFLRGQADSFPGSVHVTVDTPRITRQAACSELQPFLPSGQRLRTRMTVGVRCVAPESWTSYVQANLSVMGFYYVANRTIQVGDILSLDDVTAREGDLLRLAGGVVFDPSHLVDHTATQRIAMGAPIKSGALRGAGSIQRGQTVRTEARGQGFVVTGEGQALQGGAPGTQIQIRASSGQVLSATVINASTVRVLM